MCPSRSSPSTALSRPRSPGRWQRASATRLGADVGVAVTGVAGPDGGTPDKPVGLVFAHAVGPDGEKAVRTELPGDRDMIRGRATAASLHLVRRLLESRHTDA